MIFPLLTIFNKNSFINNNRKVFSHTSSRNDIIESPSNFCSGNKEKFELSAGGVGWIYNSQQMFCGPQAESCGCSKETREVAHCKASPLAGDTRTPACASNKSLFTYLILNFKSSSYRIKYLHNNNDILSCRCYSRLKKVNSHGKISFDIMLYQWL